MKLNAKDALERVGLENKSSVLVERLSFGEAQSCNSKGYSKKTSLNTC